MSRKENSLLSGGGRINNGPRRLPPIIDARAWHKQTARENIRPSFSRRCTGQNIHINLRLPIELLMSEFVAGNKSLVTGSPLAVDNNERQIRIVNVHAIRSVIAHRAANRLQAHMGEKRKHVSNGVGAKSVFNAQSGGAILGF